MLNISEIKKTDKPEFFARLDHIEMLRIHRGTDHNLFILIHGWQNQASDLDHIYTAISRQEPFKQATILAPELKTNSLLSTTNINDITRNVFFLIDNFWKIQQNKKQDLENIYIIGHSVGALIARKVYLCAYGELENRYTFEDEIKYGKNKKHVISERKDWVHKIKRIILLAGINNGWSSSPSLHPLVLFGTDFAVVLDTLLSGLTQHFFVFQFRKNSRFITNLRLQWLLMSQDQERKTYQSHSRGEADKIAPRKTVVIQLLGTQDSKVSPKDSIDYVTGESFFYQDLPNTNHTNILDLANLDEERSDIFIQAITTPNPKENFLSIQDLYDRPIIPPYGEYKNVVFVIHGIRDQGFWTRRIARRIKEKALENQQEKWISETSSYGFFGMLPFLFPYLRNQKVEWFMEKYIENRSLFPDADFHFVGHSNGTFLLAEALDKYSSCKFKNVVFAGSVVDSQYDWRKIIEDRKQVKEVLNFVATADWVVAVLPNFWDLRIGPWKVFGWNNIGGAGHKGFDFHNLIPGHLDAYQYLLYDHAHGVHQLKFIKGDHGTAIQEKNWNLIADFILQGGAVFHRAQEEDQESLYEAKTYFQKEQHLVVQILGFFRHPIWFFLLFTFVIIGTRILLSHDQFMDLSILAFKPSSLPFLGSLSALVDHSFLGDLLARLRWLIMGLYLFVLWQFLTRF